MKQKDLILIIVVVFIAGVFSFIVSNMLFSAPKNQQTQVEVVDPITADAESFKLDERFFNANAVNPTKPIEIGNSSNPDPIKSEQ